MEAKGNSISCVVVGDLAVGKSSLIKAYAADSFSRTYTPTVIETFALQVSLNGRNCLVSISDTSGAELYANFRSICFPKADVFLLCFALTNPETLASVQRKWTNEIRRFAKATVPVILVGTKADLNRMIAQSEAVAVARQIGATSYLECSALTLKGVKWVFDEAFLSAAGVGSLKDGHFLRDLCCCF